MFGIEQLFSGATMQTGPPMKTLYLAETATSVSLGQFKGVRKLQAVTDTPNQFYALSDDTLELWQLSFDSEQHMALTSLARLTIDDYAKDYHFDELYHADAHSLIVSVSNYRQQKLLFINASKPAQFHSFEGYNKFGLSAVNQHYFLHLTQWGTLTISKRESLEQSQIQLGDTPDSFGANAVAFINAHEVIIVAHHCRSLMRVNIKQQRIIWRKNYPRYQFLGCPQSTALFEGMIAIAHTKGIVKLSLVDGEVIGSITQFKITAISRFDEHKLAVMHYKFDPELILYDIDTGTELFTKLAGCKVNMLSPARLIPVSANKLIMSDGQSSSLWQTDSEDKPQLISGFTKMRSLVKIEPLGLSLVLVLNADGGLSIPRALVNPLQEFISEVKEVRKNALTLALLSRKLSLFSSLPDELGVKIAAHSAGAMLSFVEAEKIAVANYNR